MSSTLIALCLVVSATGDSFSAPPPPPAGQSSSTQQQLPPPPPDLPLPPPPPDEPAPPPPRTDSGFTPESPSQLLKPGARPSKQHIVSITMSPLLLFLPVAEVSGEFRITEKMGASAIVGIGGPLGLLMLEFGAQYRYYLIGSFDHGMELGAQTSVVLFPELNAVGFAVSPFVGYKIATNVGFTFEAQVGPSFTVVGATATLTGVNAVANGSIGLLLNLSVGWSF